MKKSIYVNVGDLYRGEPGDEEPSWVENERDSFRTYRDKDHDGVLDHDEVGLNLIPTEIIDPSIYCICTICRPARFCTRKTFCNVQVKFWIFPDEYDQAEAEATHLIHESDTDSDGKLTKDEILEKYDVFVGSQATDFGEALVKHDEF